MPALDPLKKAAIYAMSLADEGGDVAKAASKADDWGWKGGKPGEITGTWFRSRPDVVVRDDFGNIVHAKTQVMSQLRKAVEAGKLPKEAATESGMRTWMRRFAEAEDAGIPREWTGKTVRAYSESSPFRQKALFSSYNASPEPAMVQISNTMRPMTNDQRETFLALLPDWSGSLDELAETARSL